MIAFKIVTSGQRKSVGVNATEYILDYPKGATVHARSGTLGVFCFKRRKDAEAFLDGAHLFKKPRFQILRVKPLTHGRVPKAIALAGTTYILSNFYESNTFVTIRAGIPKGTICYSAVKVLD